MKLCHAILITLMKYKQQEIHVIEVKNCNILNKQEKALT